MSHGCRTRVAAVLLLLILWPGHGRAQDDGAPLPVALRVDDCVDADPNEVERIFRLELRTTSAASGATPERGVTRVELSCAGELVEIQVHDPLTGKSLTRRIQLEPRRPGSERLLALAAMELLVASWIELETTPEPAVPPAAAPAPEQARRHARTVARRQLPRRGSAHDVRSEASVLALALADGEAVHRGVAARYNRDWPGRLGWSVDLQVLTVTQSLSLGRATTSAAQLSGALSVRQAIGSGAVRVAAGGRVGIATISGDPAGEPQVIGGHLTGVVGGPIARLEVTVPLAGPLQLAAAAEGGYHLFSVKGQVNGSAELSLAGAWAMAQLGVGWRW